MQAGTNLPCGKSSHEQLAFEQGSPSANKTCQGKVAPLYTRLGFYDRDKGLYINMND